MSQPVPIPRIHPLSSTLVSQIAAGEVIERPVSVVKELVENALDAGASEITVDIEGAGATLVRVCDDGMGIHPDDLSLALDRHATSKLKTFNDLVHVASLGFRGEALPSIASISHFSIRSRAKGFEQGWELNNDSGKLVPVAHPFGTTVEVRDLFYNTPVRRKFMKSDRTEFLHILALLKALGLCYSNTRFKLRYHGKQTLHYMPAGQDPKRRIMDVLGAAFMNNSLPVQGTYQGMQLQGWVGRPAYVRSQRDRQFLFLNGRMIRNSSINHAIRVAYQDTIYPGRHNAYVLQLAVDPSLVDVNIHPTKYEVRFQHLREIHDFVFGKVSECLGRANPQSSKQDLPNTADTSGQAALFQAGGHASPTADAASLWQFYKKGGHTPPIKGACKVQDRSVSSPSSEARITADGPVGTPYFLQQGPYILIKRGDKILLINMPAALRVLAAFELYQQICGSGVAIRPLSVPFNLPVDAMQRQCMVSKQAQFRHLGFELEADKPDRIGIRGFPSLLPGADLAALLEEVGHFLLHTDVSDWSGHAEEISQCMAQHVDTFMSTVPSEARLRDLLVRIDAFEKTAHHPSAAPWCLLADTHLDTLLGNR